MENNRRNKKGNSTQCAVELVRLHKCPLRVLHIGNIANNAYQNAKILRENGIDCDVLCNDYYHSMGCPEWDDADFEGDIGDQFFPAWDKVDLNGFRRPEWFAQGPYSLCAEYLTARHAENTKRAQQLWKRMEWYRRNQTKRWFKFALKMKSYLQRFRRITKRFFEIAKKGPGAIVRKICLMIKFVPEIDRLAGSENEQIELNTAFPEHARSMGKLATDYKSYAQSWLPLFEQYDIVIGYATSCIYPYMAGYKNYIAFEHGTIRDIPYDDNDTGSATLLAYANAKAIYSTNIDCYQSAKYIARPHNVPIVCGLHGLDIERIIQKMEYSKKEKLAEFEKEEGIPLIYSPCRLDFRIKGNDKLLNVLIRLAKEGRKFTAVLAQWGNDLEKAEEIIGSCKELNPHVRWVPPLNRTQFYYALTQTDAVVDNLMLPAFGAIAIETMCANSPVLIQKEFVKGIVEKYTDEPMPYYPINGEQDLYNALVQVTEQTPDYLQKRTQGRQWALQYHGREAIRNKLMEAIAHAM